MVQPTFNVQLVEGGAAQVAPGDPAYPVCQLLRKAGYSSLVLPLLTVVTGVPVQEVLMEAIDTIDDVHIVAAAAWLDQSARLPEVPCTHHYVIESPQPDRPMMGVCKGCGAEKEFPKILSVLESPWTGDSVFPSRDKMAKERFLEWRSRMDHALQVASGRSWAVNYDHEDLYRTSHITDTDRKPPEDFE